MLIKIGLTIMTFGGIGSLLTALSGLAFDLPLTGAAGKVWLGGFAVMSIGLGLAVIGMIWSA